MSSFERSKKGRDSLRRQRHFLWIMGPALANWFASILQMYLLFRAISAPDCSRLSCMLLRGGPKTNNKDDINKSASTRRPIQQLIEIFWILWMLALFSSYFYHMLTLPGRCYLLALALGLKTSFIQISFAVALGSLVTLLPISISGLGTREAAIVAYLGTAGVPAEMALSFSLLVFLTFYVAGGLMGAVAWWVKPIQIKR